MKPPSDFKKNLQRPEKEFAEKTAKNIQKNTQDIQSGSTSVSLIPKTYILLGRGQLGSIILKNFKIATNAEQEDSIQIVSFSMRQFLEGTCTEELKSRFLKPSSIVWCLCGRDFQNKQALDILDSLNFVSHRVHFSASLLDARASRWHPLMTFKQNLDESRFKDIVFVGDEMSIPFSELFPFLNNRVVNISSGLFRSYHAEIVFALSATVEIWQNYFQILETKFSVSREISYPLLDQLHENLKKSAEQSLSGPLDRGEISEFSDLMKYLQITQGRVNSEMMRAFMPKEYFNDSITT